MAADTGGTVDSGGIDDTAPADTGSADDTAVEDTATADDTAPTDTAPTDTAPTDTAAADTATADTATADTATADTATADTAAADATTADGAVTTDTATADVDGDTGPDTGCASSADCTQPATGCLANVCLAGVCTPQTLPDATPCDDGDPCSAKSACAGGVCKQTAALDCDDGTPCTSDGCDPTSGACKSQAAAAGTSCDDDNPCTNGSACDGKGACGGGANTCGCKTISDCAAYDDQDPCNGTLYCNLALAVPACEVLPGSAVVCDETAGGPCQKVECSAFTGQCEAVPVNDGSACDDGNPCTKGEFCAKGACAPAVNTCQCAIAADCASYDDGNACNGTLYCDTSTPDHACKVNPASIVTCPKAPSACQASACEPKTGACKLAPLADGTACEDGDAKTVGDSCQQGACKPGTSIAQCKGDADCAKFEDGDYCNGIKFCNLATGLCEDNPGTAVQCPTVDDTTCSKAQCEPKSGLCKPKLAINGTPCDDGDGCTAGDSCQSGQCTASASTCECKQDSDCAAKEDGDLCNGTLFCDKAASTCKLNPNTIVVCPKALDTACSSQVCQPKTGACVAVATTAGTSCDDGNLCTSGDACSDGLCKGTKTCACEQDSDCAAQEDGNLCNGTLYCNKKSQACEVNPATVKVCPTAQDTACSHNVCEPSTGSCKMIASSNGVACNADDNPCTANDFCSSGVCKAGVSVCECYTDEDCKTAADADACVLSMACVAKTHACKPVQQVKCDLSGDGPCRKTQCDPKDGQCKVKQQPIGTVCGESAICAGAQICDAKGACVPGEASDCDDADDCTADACDPKKGCTFTAKDSGPCDDGSICTSGDACSKGKCVGTATDCSDETPCTDDACDPQAGCVHLPAKATSTDGKLPCNDGDLCSVGDFCFQGLCLPGSKVLACDDGNPCTGDSCDPVQGCVAKAVNGGKCDDGDGCTKLDACQGGACKGVQLSCDDGSGCTVDSCDKDEGCVHLPQTGTACDDGNACTVGDACISSGLCASGQPKLCDDANPCTVDLCDPLQGCVTKQVVGSKCDDGNACTVNEKCDKGQCTGSPRDCDDGLVCSKDTCDADAGCLYAVTAGSKCDDGNACTAGDTCAKGGACVPGPGLSCDDNNGCTTDACDPASGCTHKALDGIGCDDGDSCTQADKCVSGSCKGSGKSCDDGLVCTTDSCDVAGGCSHEVQKGATCSDDNACSSGDSCLQSGYCKPGAAVDCDDGKPCTYDTCAADKGCSHVVKGGAACDDGDACTTQDVCNAQAVCAGQTISCDDGKSCTNDSCDKLAGCKNAVKTGQPCDDGSACTVGDSCLASGTCASGPAPDCNDSIACTLDSCDPKIGCTHTQMDDKGCDDGSACTSGDVCKGSSCVGSPVDCDDGQACTKDGCNQATGCSHLPLFATETGLGASCNDGNACTQDDRCSKAGTCAPGKGIACNDGKVCTSDACDADKGCVYIALEGIGCDDGDACTVQDACAEGSCKGSPRSCDDGEGCTVDSCDKQKGCTYQGKTGTSCDDGSGCTDKDACDAKGSCVGGPKTCDDGNVCTLDTCLGTSGCVFTKLQGAACDDGKVCTGNDACANGVCAGTTLSCDDANPCTSDACDANNGCVHGDARKPCKANGDCASGDTCNAGLCKTTPATCNDGNECTVSDACSDGACVGAKKDCSDGNDCTKDICYPAIGCLHENSPASTACDDEDACTIDTCDGLGTCQTSPELWTHALPANYTPHDMVGLANGNVIVVGATSTLAGGAFFQTIVPAGKQPAPVLTSQGTYVPYEWRQLKLLASGDLFATGTIRYAQSDYGCFGRLGVDGKIQVIGTFPVGDSKAPRRFSALAVGTSYGIGAGVVSGQLEDENQGNGVRFVFAQLSDAKIVANHFWKPSDVDRYSRIDVNGVATLDGDEAAAYVTVSNNLRTTLWQVRVKFDGTIAAWPMRKYPGGTLTTHNLALHSLVLPLPGGGFESSVVGDGLSLNAGLRVDAKGRSYVHNGLGPAVDAAVLRGDQTIVAVGTSLQIFHHALSGNPVDTQIPAKPKLLRIGSHRTILSLSQAPAASGVTQWHVQRFDPWGYSVCNPCFVLHADEGCAAKDSGCLDVCRPSDGACGKSSTLVACFPTYYCDDGDPCTTDGFVNGKCTHSVPVDANGATPACAQDVSCMTSVGTCHSAGGCMGAHGFKECPDLNPCIDEICYGTSACSGFPNSAKLPSGATCGTGATCVSGSCVNDSVNKVTLTPANPSTYKTYVSKSPVDLVTFKLGGKKLRWLRVKLVLGSGSDFVVELMSPTGPIKLFDTNQTCLESELVTCLPEWSTPTVQYPAPNRPVQWIEALINQPDANDTTWSVRMTTTYQRVVTGYTVEYDTL